MDGVAGVVQVVAYISGGLVILVPVVQTIRLSLKGISRSTGRGSKFRSWPFVVLIAAVWIGAGAILWKPLPSLFHPAVHLILFWLGAALYFQGVGLYCWGFWTLRTLFGVSSAFGADLYKGHRLVTHGPFALVRHPMYLGVMLAAFGGLLLFQTWAMLIFAPMSLVVIKRTANEDSLLQAAFGKDWEDYSQRVPAWLPRGRKSRR